MQKLNLFYIILLSFPWLESQGCSQAGHTTQLLFIQQLGVSKTFMQIGAKIEILSRPDLRGMYITIHNQKKFLRFSIKQCINHNPGTISCRTQSQSNYHFPNRFDLLLDFHLLELNVIITNLIDNDCMYHIEKLHPQLQYAFHSFTSHTNSMKSNETFGFALDSYDPNRVYYYLNESNKSVLALVLSIVGTCLCFIFSGLFWYLYRRYRRRRRERRQRELCIYSTKKPVGQFPVTVYMEENQAKDFPGDTQPTCGICLERFRSHTRVRKLSKIIISIVCFSLLINQFIFFEDCSHYFHVACLNSWVLRHEKCPLCRQSIFPEPLPTVSAEIVIYNDAPTDISMLSEAF